MGSMISTAMDDNMKKQQEFMLQNQEVVMKRQLAMQHAMMERQMAMQVARARELFHWTGSFYSLLAVGLTAGAVKNKRPTLLAPLLPISFLAGYQWDMAYNGKMIRIRNMAEGMIKDEADLLLLPNNMPKFSEIEDRRERASKQ